MAHQLLRSGTSIGANTAEARSAESRANYAHKLSIALKEGRECKFWIRLLAASQIVSEPAVQLLLEETEELIAIFTSIVIKLKAKQR